MDCCTDLTKGAHKWEKAKQQSRHVIRRQLSWLPD
nr:MAG TPA: hypothetical protein [Caudoviricetes sp.]